MIRLLKNVVQRNEPPPPTPTRSARTLVIGDLHGCYDELKQLLDIVPLTSEDRIVHIGDLIDRGPYPREVVNFFRTTPNAISIMGNRDEKHIRAFEGEASYTESRKITRYGQFPDMEEYAEVIAYFRTLPLYLDLPEAYLVHAYYEPGKPIQEQDEGVLMGLVSGEKRLSQLGYKNWYEHYEEAKPVIVGHREYPFLHYHRRVYAVDTRCVYGGTLTGLLLPDMVFYAVPARENHWLTVQARYATVLDKHY